jgi:twitching motility protein PilT
MGALAMALRMISATIMLPREQHLPLALEDVCRERRGLFLVTGPTGHGKSTTLAAMIQQINTTRSEHIVTIEDPIEYLFNSEASMIHQREVGSDTNSFTESLRRVLRQDPDVIMIGEMRDLETISAAITAAETGHLVFATLHTPDAAQSIDRIVDVFTASQQNQVRLQLSNILIGICSQQLIPRMGGGRVVATELLLANPAIRNCIREGKTSQIKTTMQTSRDSGMHTMDQDLVRLVREGKLEYGNAQRFAYDIKEFESLSVM